MAGLNVINADGYVVQDVLTEALINTYDVPTEVDTIIQQVRDDINSSNEPVDIEALVASYLVTQEDASNRGVTFWALHSSLCLDITTYAIAKAVVADFAGETGGETYVGTAVGLSAYVQAEEIQNSSNYETVVPTGNGTYDSAYWYGKFTSMKGIAQQLAAAYIDLFAQADNQQDEEDSPPPSIGGSTLDAIDALDFDIEPFEDQVVDVQIQTEDETEETEASADLLTGFAKQTDKYGSFSELIHQRGTFAPVKFVSTQFKKRKDDAR